MIQSAASRDDQSPAKAPPVESPAVRTPHQPAPAARAGTRTAERDQRAHRIPRQPKHEHRPIAVFANAKPQRLPRLHPHLVKHLRNAQLRQHSGHQILDPRETPPETSSTSHSNPSDDLLPQIRRIVAANAQINRRRIRRAAPPAASARCCCESARARPPRGLRPIHLPSATRRREDADTRPLRPARSQRATQYRAARSACPPLSTVCPV